jgi:hypothetical protein
MAVSGRVRLSSSRRAILPAASLSGDRVPAQQVRIPASHALWMGSQAAEQAEDHLEDDGGCGGPYQVQADRLVARDLDAFNGFDE